MARPSVRVPLVVALPGMAVAYALVAHVSLQLALPGASASPVWPPAGLAIAAVLLLGRRIVPGIFLGEFAANLWHGSSWPVAATMGTGNVLEALAAAWLIERWHPHRFETEPVGLARFAGSAAIAAIISASFGVSALVASGAFPAAVAPMVWVTWWAGNVAGAILLTPLLCMLVRARTPWRRPAESALTLVLLGAVVFAGFFLWTKTPGGTAVLLLALPILLMSALRHNARTVGIQVVAIVMAAILATGANRGPLYSGNTNADLLLLGFLASNLSLTFLSLAIVQARQRDDHQALERDVAARTLALAGIRDRFRAFMENLPGHAWIKDASGRYVYVNPSFAAAFAHTEGDITGRRDDELFPAHEAERMAAHDQATRNDQGVTSHEETRPMGRNPQATALVTRFRLRAADGSQPFVGGVAVDVTDRKRAEREHLRAVTQAQEIKRLQELDDLKGEFLNFASHELRTPLTPMLMQIHILMMHADSMPHAAQRATEILERNAQRLIRLVDEIMAGSQAQAANLHLDREGTDMRDLGQRLLDEYKPAADERGVRFEATLQETPVHADPERMLEVMDHLVANAMRSVSPGGRIHLEIRPYEDGAYIAVEDDGKGIPPEKMDRLFRPFSHLHDEMSNTETSRGLGLFVARTLVSLHGGKITCTSAGEGKGARFVVTIPGARPNAEATDAPDEGSQPTPAPGAPTPTARQPKSPRPELSG